MCAKNRRPKNFSGSVFVLRDGRDRWVRLGAPKPGGTGARCPVVGWGAEQAGCHPGFEDGHIPIAQASR